MSTPRPNLKSASRTATIFLYLSMSIFVSYSRHRCLQQDIKIGKMDIHASKQVDSVNASNGSSTQKTLWEHLIGHFRRSQPLKATSPLCRLYQRRTSHGTLPTIKEAIHHHRNDRPGDFLSARIIRRDTDLYLSQPGHMLKISKEAGITDDYPRVRTLM